LATFYSVDLPSGPRALAQSQLTTGEKLALRTLLFFLVPPANAAPPRVHSAPSLRVAPPETSITGQVLCLPQWSPQHVVSLMCSLWVDPPPLISTVPLSFLDFLTCRPPLTAVPSQAPGSFPIRRSTRTMRRSSWGRCLLRSRSSVCRVPRFRFSLYSF